MAGERAAGTAHPPMQVAIVSLCIVSGSVDAISLLALGDAFASVMTGNIVFLGVAAGRLDAALAIASGAAIAGYVGGVLVGSRLSHRWRRAADRTIWPSRVTKTLAVELVLAVALGTAWLLTDQSPDRALQLGFLFAAAWMMGMQGAAVRAVGVPVSTTYMTGALTTLLEAIVVRRQFSHTESTAITGLSALATGALLGALAVTYVSPAAWAVPVAGLTVVVAMAVWMQRSTPERSP
ncbi:MAG: hypothetical protein JWP95_1640 [Actinotalea sp.]|nr:hypothetical protein [Actinotalea sp.]